MTRSRREGQHGIAGLAPIGEQESAIRRSIFEIVASCAFVSWVVLAAGGCGSSEAAADAGQGDGPTPVEEPCLDADATEPPLRLFASRWGDEDCNAGFMTHLTTAARRCQWTSLGARCVRYDCLEHDWTGEAATMMGISAGMVTVGNGIGADEVLAAPGADGVYDRTDISGPRWNGGDTITFTALGATIPAFTLSIGMPSPLQATDPARPADGVTPELDRSAPFRISWPPTDEKVLVIVHQGPSSGATWDYLELQCLFDGPAGAGTVPVEALQTLKTGLASSLNIAHCNRRCYGVDGYHLQAMARNGVSWEVRVK
jgi:hypothetical protein